VALEKTALTDSVVTVCCVAVHWRCSHAQQKDFFEIVVSNTKTNEIVGPDRLDHESEEVCSWCSRFACHSNRMTTRMTPNPF
jgi:hypothetical protein